MRQTFEQMKLVPDMTGDADEVMAMEGQASLEWIEPRPLMPLALQIPGALHFLDNLQKDLLGCLANYNAHLQKLKIFQPLLHEPDYRQRLQWTCLKGRASNTSESVHEQLGFQWVCAKLFACFETKGLCKIISTLHLLIVVLR